VGALILSMERYGAVLVLAETEQTVACRRSARPPPVPPEETRAILAAPWISDWGAEAAHATLSLRSAARGFARRGRCQRARILAGVTGRPAAPGAPAGLSRGLDRTFRVGLLLKAADGVLEVVAGTLLLIVSPSTIERIARSLTAHELSEDPRDRIAHFILHSTSHLSSGATLFAAVYLLSHGVSKVVLVALVLRDKLWAYPWLMGLLGAFIAYQLYVLILVRFSWSLTALTVFDALLVWLTWREYQAKRARRLSRVRDLD
jgi:uncharacterized membrane protein